MELKMKERGRQAACGARETLRHASIEWSPVVAAVEVDVVVDDTVA